MKALLAYDRGDPSRLIADGKLVLADVADPAPGAGQVLVRVEAAALNPFDLKLLTGSMGAAASAGLPYIPGMDGAGVLAAVGDDVEGFAVGDEVLGFFGRTPGTIAEYAVIDAGPYLVKRPAGLDAARAAAIPESGLTARSLLRGAAPQAGQTVLVIGATGGVGMFVVQLAAAAGARVLATAGPADAGYVRELGAADVIDYKAGDVVEQARRACPDGVDVVFDLVDSGERLVAAGRAARPGGVLVSPLGGPEDLGGGVTAVYRSLSGEAGDLEDLTARVAAGTLRVEVSRVYALEQSPRAFADFAEKHTRGKLVVAVDSRS